MTREEFKKRLKKLKISQKDFAKEMEYSYSAVKAWSDVPKWVEMVLLYKELVNVLEPLNMTLDALRTMKKLEVID